MGRELEPAKKQKNMQLVGTSSLLLILACVAFIWFAFELMSVNF